MKLSLRNPVDRQKAQVYLQKLISLEADIELRKVEKSRSVSQNSYLHVCLAIFCNESGYMMDEAKEIFSQLMPEMLRYERNGFDFRRSTSTLNTQEMNLLIEKIRSVCSEELGVYVPNSEEYLINKFAIDKEVQYVR